MARRKSHQRVGDFVRIPSCLACQDDRRREVECSQADDIGVDPPPTLFQQEFVAEEVGERRHASTSRAAGIREDGGCGQGLAGVFDNDSRGNIADLLITVQMVLMPMEKEGRNREFLERPQGFADPKALDDRGHGCVLGRRRTDW